MPGLFVRRRRATAWGALVAVVALAVPLTGIAEARTVTRAEVEAAASVATRAADAFDLAQQQLAQATGDRDRYRESLERISARQTDLAGRSALNTATVRDRVARMYMVAGAGTLRLAVEDVAAFTARIAYLGAIAERDRRAVIDLAFSANDLAGLQAEAQDQLAMEEQRVAAATAAVVARSVELDAARAENAAVQAEWQIQEDVRRAALEAELRAQEAALQAATTTTSASTTTTTATASTVTPTTVGTTTTTTPGDYGWDPGGGVGQWRGLVTSIFSEWGLDVEKCGPRGCVGPQIDNALVIMKCESNGIPFATAGPDNEQGVVGLFQHRLVYWPDRVARARSRGFSALPSDATPWNPEHNIIVAALLVWESRESLIGNLNYGRPWSDGPEPWGHWDSSSRYCADPPLVTP